MMAADERLHMVAPCRGCAIRGRGGWIPRRSGMHAKPTPSALFVYFTYTKQTLKVVEAMSEVLERRGCDVHHAAIEFEDPRYASRFEAFPMPHPYREVYGMIP